MTSYIPIRSCSACLSGAAAARSAAPALRRRAAAFSSTSSSCASDDSPSTGANPTPSPASTKSSQKDDSGRPPPLPRPLGVPQPPRKHVKPSLKEWRERLLDQDARIQERRHLVKEATTGYFEDYHKLRHEGGKAWIAPKTLIQEKAALYFPEMEGSSLAPPSGQKDTTVHTSEMLRGKISLVVMLSTRISEAHVESYTKAILSKPEIKDDPNFQFVQINCQENKLKWILVGIFISALRKSIPEEFRKTYVVSTENLEYLREPIGMTNKHVGYVYLVDENAKIRWAAVSFANTGHGKSAAEWDSATDVDEVEALVTCTKVLLQRLKAGST